MVCGALALRLQQDRQALVIGALPGRERVEKLPREASGFFARFSRDFDGNYFEFGYGTTISAIDFSVSLILPDDDLVGDEDETIVFGISKSFDIN